MTGGVCFSGWKPPQSLAGVCAPSTLVRLEKMLPHSLVCCLMCVGGQFSPSVLPLDIADFKEILFSVSVGQNTWAHDVSSADPCNDGGLWGQQGDRFCSLVKRSLLQPLLERYNGKTSQGRAAVPSGSSVSIQAKRTWWLKHGLWTHLMIWPWWSLRLSEPF